MHEKKLSDKMSACKTYFDDYDLGNLVNYANKEALDEVKTSQCYTVVHFLLISIESSVFIC